MKTFKDLKFKKHSTIPEKDAKQAKMSFSDGSNISVITGSKFFYCGPNTYEMMSSRSKGDGVRGHLTEKQITNHMRYVQRNPLN